MQQGERNSRVLISGSVKVGALGRDRRWARLRQRVVLRSTSQDYTEINRGKHRGESQFRICSRCRHNTFSRTSDM